METDKVPALSQGWLALDNETLVPVNGSGAGSPFPLPGKDLEVPEWHLLRPFNLAYNLSVLTSMHRDSGPYVLAVICQQAKDLLGLQNGACCAIRSYKATIHDCVVVCVFPGVGVVSDGLHDWTVLPATVKVLHVYQMNLTEGLPVSFGNASASLEGLFFVGNNATGMLPEAWANLPALKSIAVPGNNLTGTLPAAWSALTNLELLQLSNPSKDVPGLNHQ